jgi:hypothetical protein
LLIGASSSRELCMGAYSGYAHCPADRLTGEQQRQHHR